MASHPAFLWTIPSSRYPHHICKTKMSSHTGRIHRLSIPLYLKDMPCWLRKKLTFAKVKCLGHWRLDHIDRLICKRLIKCLLNKTLTCVGVRWPWIVIVTFICKMISAHHAQFLKSPIEDFFYETELIWLIW